MTRTIESIRGDIEQAELAYRLVWDGYDRWYDRNVARRKWFEPVRTQEAINARLDAAERDAGRIKEHIEALQRELDEAVMAEAR